MKKKPKNLSWSWTRKLEDCEPWEKQCEESFQEFKRNNPNVKIPFLSMIYKLAWADCLRKSK